MQDQPVVGVLFKLVRDKFHQIIFNCSNVFTFCKARAIRYSEDVGVHSDGWFPKGGIKNNIRRFSSDTGKRFQGFSIFGYRAVVFVYKDLASFQNVFSFRIE